jgi:competence protein ComEA
MQLPEVSRRQAVVICVLALIVLIVAGKLLGARHAAQATSSHARLARAASTKDAGLYVDVAGAVHRPGLYRLPPGSRINDALARAGGATAIADLNLVNRAAPVTDGEQVLVPEKVAQATAGAAAATGDPSAPAGPVHLNSATAEQLDALPGIGPATAQRIIDYRTQHGPFTSVDELDSVSGIGPAKMAELRGLVTP